MLASSASVGVPGEAGVSGDGVPLQADMARRKSVVIIEMQTAGRLLTLFPPRRTLTLRVGLAAERIGSPAASRQAKPSGGAGVRPLLPYGVSSDEKASRPTEHMDLAGLPTAPR